MSHEAADAFIPVTSVIARRLLGEQLDVRYADSKFCLQ